MDNVNNVAMNDTQGKKEMRKELADKISAAIPEMQIKLGDKKFQHRIKKAVKLITEGLHKKEAAKAVKTAKTAAKKMAVLKKAAAKKVKAVNKASS